MQSHKCQSDEHDHQETRRFGKESIKQGNDGYRQCERSQRQNDLKIIVLHASLPDELLVEWHRYLVIYGKLEKHEVSEAACEHQE